MAEKEIGQQLAWSAGKPGVENAMLRLEADTAAYAGHLHKARETLLRAIESAKRAGEKEAAAGYESDMAFREAVFGNVKEAEQHARAALALSSGREVQYGAALALAEAGNAKGESLADQLQKQFPEDTIVRFIYLPTIQAELVLRRNDPAKAIDALQAAAPYELGSPGNTAAFTPSLYPIYVRVRHTSLPIADLKLPPSLKGSLTGAASSKTSPLPRWPISDSRALTPYRAIPPRRAPPTKPLLKLWKEAVTNIPVLEQARSDAKLATT